MNHDHVHAGHIGHANAAPFWRSRYAVGLLVFGAIATYFLVSEHRAHFFSALPFLLLMACPLMHMFMHGGHGGHGGGHGEHASGKQAAKKFEPEPAPRAGEQP